MSTGKGTKSIRKSQQGNDLLPSVGFLNTVAKHKATLGQTVIDITSLTVPTEATLLGFVQPSGPTLNAIDLQRFKNNVRLESTIRGIMDNPLSYRITGSKEITLSVGAFENEIFTIVVEARPRVGTTLVAAQPKVQSYTLPAGQTDIPVGPYTINRNPGEDIGEFMVVIDRGIMYRNTDNMDPGLGIDGDYKELTGIVRMNEADPDNDRKVNLVWVGALVDNPQDSQLAMIQTLGSQIDAMIPTLAALAGVDTTDFQAAPNDVDLAAFGADVITAQSDIDALQTAVSFLQSYANPEYALYENLAGTSINNSSTLIPFNTLRFESSSGLFVGGQFVCTKAGKFAFSIHMFSATTLPVTTAWYMQGKKNNTTIYAQNVKAGTGASNTSNSVHVSGIVDLEAGETFGAFSNLDTATSISLVNSSGVNTFSIHRIVGS